MEDTQNHKKIIVFDLDETLGHFTQIGIFYDIINKFYSIHTGHYEYIKYIKKPTFEELMDMYPEFLRPNMIKILKYINNAIEKNKVNTVMIYTNNQGHNAWANSIVDYLNKKIGSKIIKHIIRAFKIGDKKIEPNRTSHMKNFNDFLKCTKLPKNTKICFVDDVEYKGMIHENVYYINILPYKYNIPVFELLDRYSRFIVKKYIKPGKNESSYITHYKNFKDAFQNYTLMCFKKYNYVIDEHYAIERKIDKIISTRLLEMIDDFINDKGE